MSSWLGEYIVVVSSSVQNMTQRSLLTPLLTSLQSFQAVNRRQFISSQTHPPFQRPAKEGYQRKPPDFDSDQFFHNLKLHNDRLSSRNTITDDWNLPWDTNLWQALEPRRRRMIKKKSDLMEQQHYHHEAINPLPLVDDNDAPSHQDGLHSQNELLFDEKEQLIDNGGLEMENPMSSRCPRDPLHSPSQSLELNDILQRFYDTLMRTKDYESAVWGHLSKDLCRVQSQLQLSQLVQILHVLSTIRCKDSMKVFMAAESTILSRLADLSPSQLISVLSSYARIELLWGINSEDDELRMSLSRTEGEEIFNGSELDVIYRPSVIPELRYYDSNQYHNQMSRKGGGRDSSHSGTSSLGGRHFVHSLVRTVALQLFSSHQSSSNPIGIHYEELVMLLFALLAQQLLLVRLCLEQHQRGQSSKKSNDIIEFHQWDKQRRYGYLLSTVARSVVFELLNSFPQQLSTTTDSSACSTRDRRDITGLAIFLLGRFKQMEDAIQQRQGRERQLQTALASPIDNSNTVNELDKSNEDDVIRLTPVTKHNQQTQQETRLEGVVLRYSASLYHHSSNDAYEKPAFGTLLLTHRGLGALGLESRDICQQLEKHISEEIPKLSAKDVIQALAQIRVLRDFNDHPWLLRLLQEGVQWNNHLSKAEKFCFRETVTKAMWWSSYEMVRVQQNKNHKKGLGDDDQQHQQPQSIENILALHDFCSALEKNRLLNRKTSYSTSFSPNKMKPFHHNFQWN